MTNIDEQKHLKKLTINGTRKQPTVSKSALEKCLSQTAVASNYTLNDELLNNKDYLEMIYSEKNSKLCVNIQEEEYHNENMLRLCPKLYKYNIYRNSLHSNKIGLGQLLVNVCSEYSQPICINTEPNNISAIINFLESCNITLTRKKLYNTDTKRNIQPVVKTCVSNIIQEDCKFDTNAPLYEYLNGKTTVHGRFHIFVSNETQLDKAVLKCEMRNINVVHINYGFNELNNNFQNIIETKSQISQLHLFKPVSSNIGDEDLQLNLCLCNAHKNFLNSVLTSSHPYKDHNKIQQLSNNNIRDSKTTFNTLHLRTVSIINNPISQCLQKELSQSDISLNSGIKFNRSTLKCNSEVNSKRNRSGTEKLSEILQNAATLSELETSKEWCINNTDKSDRITAMLQETITTDFSKCEALEYQKGKSLSQPSFPTYLLQYTSTDDEQSMCTNDELSQCAENDKFAECEDNYFNYSQSINEENISKYLGDFTENDLLPENSSFHNVLETDKCAMRIHPVCNQNKHYTHTSKLIYLENNCKDIFAELEDNICNGELLDKPSISQENKNFRFNETERRCLLPLLDTNTTNKCNEFPSNSTQYKIPTPTLTNISGSKQTNSTVEMEYEINDSITEINGCTIESEYPSINVQLVPEINVLCSGFAQTDTSVILNRQKENTCDMESKLNCNVNAITENVINKNKCEGINEKNIMLPLPLDLMCGADMEQDIPDVKVLCTASFLPNKTDIINKQLRKATFQTQNSKTGRNDTNCNEERISKVHNEHEVYMDSCSHEETDILSKTVSQDNICCSNINLQQQPHATFTNIKLMSSKFVEDNFYQVQPVSNQHEENNSSQNYFSEDQGSSIESALDLCIDMALKKYRSCSENDEEIHIPEVKETHDVQVQTVIKSLIKSSNDSCFVCFNNIQQPHNDNLKGRIHQNIALKRHIEALCLESISTNKKPRCDICKPVNFEYGISMLPLKSKSKYNNLYTDDYTIYNDDERHDLEHLKHQLKQLDNPKKDEPNFVNLDQKVPDIERNICCIEDDTSQKELYVRHHTAKYPSKVKPVFQWNNNHCSLKMSKHNIEEGAQGICKSIRRSIRIGLSRKAQPQPLHSRYTQK